VFEPSIKINARPAGVAIFHVRLSFPVDLLRRDDAEHSLTSRLFDSLTPFYIPIHLSHDCYDISPMNVTCEIRATVKFKSISTVNV